MNNEQARIALQTIWRVYGSIIAAAIDGMIKDGLIRDRTEAIMIAARISDMR